MVEQIEVTVVMAAGKGVVEVVPLTLERDSRIDTAIAASGLPARHPALRLDEAKYGIWGKLMPAQTLLRGGDRIEIYSALIVDPKTARRRRAQKRLASQTGDENYMAD